MAFLTRPAWTSELLRDKSYEVHGICSLDGFALTPIYLYRADAYINFQRPACLVGVTPKVS